MSVDQMIRRLQALPRDVRKLPVVSYEESLLVALEKPRVGYRDRHGVEVQDRRAGKPVLIL